MFGTQEYVLDDTLDDDIPDGDNGINANNDDESYTYDDNENNAGNHLNCNNVDDNGNNDDNDNGDRIVMIFAFCRTFCMWNSWIFAICSYICAYIDPNISS